MVKKKRTAKRSTKAAKRRPAMKHKAKSLRVLTVAANFDPTPYLIAAPQRKLSAAVQSTAGEVSPPSAGAGLTADAPILETRAVMAGSSNLIADAIVIPAPVPVTPTVYPDSPPAGTIIVHGNVTINIESVHFKTFNTNADTLVKQLQVGRSNQISGDVSAQLLSEIMAGRELLKGPKPSRALIDLLLVRRLKYLAEKAAGGIIGKLASLALDALLKMIM